MSIVINQISIPTLNDNQFPVGRIFCVGQNYAAHTIEMGGDPSRNPPFFFSKWSTALVNAAVADEAQIPYPEDCKDFQPEIELAIAIKTGGKAITVDAAKEHIFGFATALDMTKRDIQAIAKNKGRPWEAAKNFDFSCPISAIDETISLNDLNKAEIILRVNDQIRQHSTLYHMIWSVEEIIAKLSEHIALLPGDLILTGTPEGVSPIQKGDVLEARIEGLPLLRASCT